MALLPFVRVFFCAASLLFLPCCKSPLKKNINLKSLPIAPTSTKKIHGHPISTPLIQESATASTNRQDIIVQARKLSKKECKRLLGIAIKKTDVIYVTATNNSTTPYELKKSDFYTEHLSITDVTQRIQERNQVIRNISINGSVYGGAAVGCYAGIYASTKAIIAFGTIHAAVLPLAIAAAGIGIGITCGRLITAKVKLAGITTHSILKRLSPEQLLIAPSKTESMLLFIDDAIGYDSINVKTYPISREQQGNFCTITI